MPSLPAALVSRPAPTRNNPPPARPASPPGEVPATPMSPRLVRSRRRRYLELHPAYFARASAELELAEPVEYDRLVRRHQSAAEREAAGRGKGLAEALTGSLLRGEAASGAGAARRRLIAGVAEAEPNGVSADESLDWSIEGEDLESQSLDAASDPAEPACQITVDDKGSEVAPRLDARARGLRAWQRKLAARFVAGADGDFAYAEVDGDAALDEGAGAVTAEERWFDEEASSPPDEREQEENGEGADGRKALQGQTGVQDF